ncbi:RHS repeat-associated core domain-containing protein [Paenibacillus caui]|uniref:RHS repeat-associated core domain-containing protein n=1 Tax=Paenibacillus caui TaxID=2873927 RepID=UPI003080E4EE
MMRSGLYYLRARYYDPVDARFISEDTYEGQITNPLSLNLYTYVGNNPLGYSDPTGHCRAGKDAGCYVDSFSGVDDFINDIWYDNLVTVKSMWRQAEDSKSACTTQKCINSNESMQKIAEARADEIRNNPCHYTVAGGCIDGNASFALDTGGKAYGVVFIPTPSTSLLEILFGKKAYASELPDKTIGSNGLGKIVHYFASGDHGPAHVHVYDNKGNMVIVGQNGKRLSGEPELNRVQQKVVDTFRPQIRSSVGQIMRWYRDRR